MNRRAVILLVFVLFLYMIPNLAAFDSPLAIPSMTKEFTTATDPADVVLGAAGTNTHMGGGQYEYVTHIGERNVWNGTAYVKFIYDQDTKQVRVGNLVFTHLTGGIISVETASGNPLIEEIHWYAQYYSASIWQNFTFADYQFLGIEETNESFIVKQRWSAANGELNVSYTYSFYQSLKMRAKATNLAALSVPVRVIWAALGIAESLSNYDLMFQNEIPIGVEIGNEQSLYWADVVNGNQEIAINPIIDKPNRRAAVVFGNISSVLVQGETMDLDPTYTLGADSDDDWWRWQSGIGWDHWAASNSISITNQTGLDYVGGQRFQLTIPKDADIDSAYLWWFCEGSAAADRYSWIRRIDETNVGSLEADVSPPTISNASESSMRWYSASYYWNYTDVTALVQEQVSLSDWTSDYYIGFRTCLDTNYPSGVNTIEDYQNPTRANNSYLVIQWRNEYDFVDQVSDLHSPGDRGSHDVFADLQDYGANNDTLTEENMAGSFPIDFKGAVDESNTTTTSTSWQTKLTLTFTPQTAGYYLIVAQAILKTSSTSGFPQVCLRIGGTIYATAILYSGNQYDYYYFCAIKRESLSGSSTINILYRSSSASYTAACWDARIFATNATIEEYAETTTRTTDAVVSSFTTMATITVTPASAGYYWILGSAILDGSSSTYSTYYRADTSNGTYLMDCLREARNTAARFSFGFSQVCYIGLAGDTINIKFDTESSSNTAGCNSTFLAALRIDQFDSYFYDADNTEYTPAVAGTWYTTSTLTYTAEAKSYLVFSCLNQKSGSTTASTGYVQGRTRLSGSSYINTDKWLSKDTSDYMSFFTFYNLTTSAGSRTDDMRYRGGSTSARVKYPRLLILELTAAVIPDNYQLDLEVGWIAADYDESNEYLCIFAGPLDAENIKVDVWNVSAWVNVFADLTANEWNNVSVATCLTDPSFEVRFLGGTEESDTTESTWDIDAVLLHTWSGIAQSLNISVSEIISLFANVTPAATWSFTVTEEIELSETVAVAMTAVLFILETIGLAAVVSTQRIAVIMVFQTIAIASAISTIMSVSITINEPLALFDSAILDILMGGEYSIFVNELIGLSGTVSSVLNTSISVSEIIGFFDSVEAIINPAVTLILYALLPIGASVTITGGLEGLNIFYDLFFSLNMWSYLGPMGLVVFGYFMAKKDRILGVLWFILECLFIAQYLILVDATPNYWWHIFILALGGLLTCVYPLWDR